MIKNKIKFSIEKTEILEHSNNSQLTKVRMWIVREGNNLHNLPISWDSINKAKETLVGKPVLCKYNKNTNSFEGHETDEIPVGVFLYNDEIYEETDEYGQKWLVADAYLWKKYFPEIINVFQNNKDNQSDVSMEIEVLETHFDDQNNECIDTFVFTGVTLIGVTPAIPNAKAVVIKFSSFIETTKEVVEKDFGKYDDISFKIPNNVKDNAKKGLELRKEYGRGGTSVGLATARYLLNNDVATPEKVRHIAKYFPRHADDNLNDKTSNGWIAWLLWGGDSGRSWSTNLVEKMNKKDEKTMSYFTNEEKNIEEEVYSMKDETEEKENKENQVEKENAEKMSELEKMSEEEQKEGQEEKNEQQEQEEQREEQEDFSNDVYLDVTAMLSFLESETQQYKEIVSEFSKPTNERNYARALDMMYECTKQMMAKKEEQFKVLMSENEELKKFKENVEREQFEFEIASTMKEVKNSIPQEEFESLQEKSKEFSLKTIDAFKNLAFAKAFEYSKNKKKTFSDSDEVIRYGLPINSEKRQTGSVWDRL